MYFNYILFHVPKGQIVFRHFKLVMIEYEFESAFLLRIINELIVCEIDLRLVYEIDLRLVYEIDL